MIKVVALLARKPGLSMVEFIDYYENSHSRLVRSLTPQLVEYRRNYLDHQSKLAAPRTPDVDFDVITELWFADRAAYDEMTANHTRPEVRKVIDADEKNFLDQTVSRMYVVEVRESE
ncbi:EthD domain-containing protein [Nocardioides sp. Bht2]|uniref:EthD domain-containing protein n=1 Tax=Nocardioides sp. Bht2 TaxID=3392297 RepID=UPI0039B46C79